MTVEEFNDTSFSSNTVVVIDGRQHYLTDVDFEEHEIYVVGRGWVDCSQFEIKPHIEIFGEATDLNPTNK